MENIELRDYIANHSPFTLNDSVELLKLRQKEQGAGEEVYIYDAITYLASLNYRYADDMLKARDIQKNKEEADGGE